MNSIKISEESHQSKIKSVPSQENHMIFGNDVVVQTIFSHLNVQEIKALRLVDKLWASEGFQALKKISTIRLKSEVQNKFLASMDNINCLKFKGFSFELFLSADVEWIDSAIMSYINKVSPQELTLEVLMTSHISFNKFLNFLSYHSQSIKELNFRAHWFPLNVIPITDHPVKFEPVPETVSVAKFPKLKSMDVLRKFPTREARENHVDSSEELSIWPVWIDIVKKSPKLKYLSIKNLPNDWWMDVTRGKSLENLESLCLQSINPEVGNAVVEIRNLNLKELELKFDPGIVDLVLSRVAHSLEVLRFITPNESALSPVTFPYMPKLKLLNSGNSKLSFPLLLHSNLPALEELQLTYWDSVWTFEQLPADNYYLNTDNPHRGVKKLVIRFPSSSDVRGTYLLMQNFPDFCNRIATKFPALDTIHLTNYWMKSISQKESQTCICKISTICRSNLCHMIKELVISSYAKDCLQDCSANGMIANYTGCESIEILDLNPAGWLKLWNGNPTSHVTFNIFQLNCNPIHNLRVAKFLWMQELKLNELVRKFPNLEQLEVVGDKCIDRMDRRNMKCTKPDLKFIQHPCKCPKEDAWCMSCPDCHDIFQKLFKEDKANGDTWLMSDPKSHEIFEKLF